MRRCTRSERELFESIARQYNGPSTCVHYLTPNDPTVLCTHLASYMPIVKFFPPGHENAYLPAALLTWGACAKHKKELTLADVDDGDAQGIVAIVKRMIESAGAPQPDLDRTEIVWIALPLRN